MPYNQHKRSHELLDSHREIGADFCNTICHEQTFDPVRLRSKQLLEGYKIASKALAPWVGRLQPLDGPLTDCVSRSSQLAASAAASGLSDLRFRPGSGRSRETDDRLDDGQSDHEGSSRFRRGSEVHGQHFDEVLHLAPALLYLVDRRQ